MSNMIIDLTKEQRDSIMRYADRKHIESVAEMAERHTKVQARALERVHERQVLSLDVAISRLADTFTSIGASWDGNDKRIVRCSDKLGKIVMTYIFHIKNNAVIDLEVEYHG